MAKKGPRRRPSSPEEIQRRRLEAQAVERERAERVKRTPGEWGVSAEILNLASAGDVTVRRDSVRGRVVHARRSDPFDLLFAAGGLSEEQHRAARRLFRDFCLRAGVRDHERQGLQRVDEGGGPSLVTDAMLDAGRRIDVALRLAGGGSARILRALIEPMVIHGAIIAWRGAVQAVTGEKDRNAQGAVVRGACENLALAYREMDAQPRLRRGAGGVA